MTISILAVLSALWVAISLSAASLTATKDPRVLGDWGAMLRPDFWITGESWRLFTAAFLHIGAEHLLINGISLWSLGRAVEALFGRWRMLYIYLVAAVGGSVLSAVLGPPVIIGAGASGAIFGLLGAVFWYRTSSPLGDRVALRPLIIVLGINLAFGLALARFIDNWNHMGGLAGGFLAAAAVGVPAEAGLEPPRFRVGGWGQAAAAALLLLLSVMPVAGLVRLPGPGSDLARAYAAFDSSDFAAAEAGFRAALRRQPDEPRLRWALAVTYYRLHRCGEAQRELNYLAELAPDNPDIKALSQAVAQCLSGSK